MFETYRKYLPLLDELELEEHEKLALLNRLHTLLAGELSLDFADREAANDDEFE